MNALPNIVLLHGAFADGSSWSNVIERLQQKGYHTTAPQLPMSSLAADVARVREVLAAQDGPTILVAHSYAGAIMSQLGADAPHVTALVFVAAFAPDQGETLQSILSQGPPSPGLSHLHPDAQGFLWLDEVGFLEDFAPDVAPKRAQVLAAVQQPIPGSSLGETFGPPAWRSFPSWFLITENDRMIPPADQQFMAQRMHARISTIAANHAVMVSRPQEVAELIEKVAQAVPAGTTK